MGLLDGIEESTSLDEKAAEAYDTAIDVGFQRPGELPGTDSTDSFDVWGGSPSNPTGDPNFQGEDRRAGPMQYLPAGTGGQIVVLLVAVVLLGQLFDVQIGGGS